VLPAAALVDELTLEILERRRAASGPRRRGWLIRRALLAADLVGLTAAFSIAEQWFGGGISSHGHLGAPAEYVLFVFCLPAWVIAAKLYGLYDKDEERADHSTADDFAGVFYLITVISWFLYAVSRFTPEEPQYRKLLVFWACAIATVPVARLLGRGYCRRRIEYLQNTAIVGAGEVGQALARKLLRHPKYGINLVGFVDDMPRSPSEDLQHIALLGGLADLADLVRLLDIERVMFAFSNDGHTAFLDSIRELSEMNVQVDIVPRFFDVIGAKVDVHTVEGFPVVGLPPTQLSRSSHFVKRMLDVFGAGLGILFLSPLFVLIAIAIKVNSRGPVFFRQVRAGCDDGLFRIWKFRTMVVDADEQKDMLRHLSIHALPGGDPRMFKIQGDPRATWTGRFLRRTSIDELPQLFNVLAGQMSLVGPRPLILEEDRYVEDWGRRRLDVKPGMTGLWQVLGRSDIPFQEMVRLDYLYVTNWSVLGDIRLLLETIPAVLRRGL